MRVSIRREEPADIQDIHRVARKAFGRRDEAELIHRLREADALLLSHAALADDAIVGHAAYSKATVSANAESWTFAALGPIAVHPDWQRQGIGGALIRAGIAAMRGAGFGLLFLVGHPSYYPRFGFQPAVPLGFTSDWVKPDEAHEHFMVYVLNADLHVPALRGHMRFHEAFDGL